MPTNQAKNTSVIANQAKSSATMTWDAATFTWQDATGTWDDPSSSTNQTKNTSVLTNQTPNTSSFSLQTKHLIELVTNGTFSGSATGWTLGDGWSYSSNTALFTYVGSDILTNGTFTGSASGWTLTGGWSYSANTAVASGTTNSLLSQIIACVTGSTYRLGYTVSANPSKFGITQFTGFTPVSGSLGTNGTYSQDLVATQSGSNEIIFNSWHFSTPFAGTLDNVSLKLLGTGAVSQTLAVTIGQTYPISVSVSGTTGSVTVALGGTSFNVPAGTTVIGNLVSASTGLTLTASTDFDGAITRVSTSPEAVWVNQTKN